MTYPLVSPSGKRVVPPDGPLDARVLAVAESPAARELERQPGFPHGKNLVGPAGRVFNAGLEKVGILRDASVRVVNLVPVRAPGDKFEAHNPQDLEWGLGLFRKELDRAIAGGVEVILALGENPLAELAPELPFPPRRSDDEGDSNEGRGRVGAWRGSVFPLGRGPHNVATYEDAAFGRVGGPYVVPLYHPSAVQRRFELQVPFLNDLGHAARLLQGKRPWAKQRRWFYNDYERLGAFADYIIAVEHAVAVDTEMSPYSIVALVSEEEVHVFEWSERAREAVQRLLDSPVVLWIAHNLGHDFTYLRSLGLRITFGDDYRKGVVDTGGLARILDGSTAPRDLSPSIATRFTSWPYHKWMVEHDPLTYCGYDTVVCYDAYWEAQEQIDARGLLNVSEHDHQLLKHLLEMQWHGFRVDESARLGALEGMVVERTARRKALQDAAEPIIRSKIEKFEKPHLFHYEKQCECCNGVGSRCWREAGLAAMPSRKAEYAPAFVDWESRTVADLKASLPACTTCAAVGKMEVWEVLNPDSDDQLKDVFYRGLGAKVRKYKGKPTVKADTLVPLAGKYPLIGQFIEYSRINADVEALERFAPGYDGRQHCVFDPWGTASGRVASNGGLVQKGTNTQNLQKKHRYIVTPDEGFVFFAPDMQQIEGRAIAVISGDEALKRAYVEPLDWPGHAKHGQPDSHLRLVQALIPYGFEISRDQAKRASYAGWYGATATQLAQELSLEARNKKKGIEVTPSQAARILELINQVLYPGIQRWHDGVVEDLLAGRSIESPTGRVFRWNTRVMHRVRDPSTPKGTRWELIEKIKKEAWSRFPQDMAAWVLALALHRIKTEAKGLLIPQIHVHDELVIGAPAAHADEAKEAIRELMTVSQWGMIFPPEVDDSAPNWKCAKGLHDFGIDKLQPCRHCGLASPNARLEVG